MTMSCDQERLSAWLDGEMTLHERLEVELHLETCASCRALVDELDQVSRHLAGDAAPEPPAALVEAIVASIPEPPRAGFFARMANLWRTRIAVPAPALAGALALGCLLLLWLPGASVDEPSTPGVHVARHPTPAYAPRFRQEGQLPLVLIQYREEETPRAIEPQWTSYSSAEDDPFDDCPAPPPPPPFRRRSPRGRPMVLEEYQEIPVWHGKPGPTY